MACLIDYVAGDTASKHGPVTCKDKAGVVIDLTGTTVKLLYRIEGGALQTRTMTILSPATEGKVEYQFISTDLTEGVMVGAVEITDSGGKIVTETCTFKRVIRAKL